MLLGDLVFFRCRQVLLPRELRLLKQRRNIDHNRMMIKNMRRELIEQNREHLEVAISAVVQTPIRCLHYDLSTPADECVLVLVLERPIAFPDN